MRIGVDFGTTRTLVALSDRGNYPVVTFEDSYGDHREFFPSVAAIGADGELVFGTHAENLPGAVRSFKRILARPDVSAHTPVPVGDRQVPLLELLVGYLTALRTQLATTSTIAGMFDDEPLETVISVPAHAHGAQRFLTLEAFRQAGFEVVAMLNEPSAAGFEFTHRLPKAVTSRRNRVVVFDLGGGTFDASLLQAQSPGTSTDEANHQVLRSVGVNQLGGDDFDATLAELAVRAVGPGDDGERSLADLPMPELADVLSEAREAKERLSPQTRRIYLEVLGESVAIAVDDYYAAATPLVRQAIEAMAPLMNDLGEDSELTTVAGIYLVGGGSSLPLVPRLLREEFGRRVHRSPYPAASTAIGLAIAADTESGYTLSDKLSRGFGVFRELRDGEAIGFDQLLDRESELPVGESVTVTRRYRAAHNVGWFRFVEYTDVTESGEPRGELVPFAEVLFPFDAGLQGGEVELSEVPVERRDESGEQPGPLVEESYTIDPHGIVTVEITDLDTGYAQEHTLRA